MANCCELFPAPKAAAHTELLWLPRGQGRRRAASGARSSWSKASAADGRKGREQPLSLPLPRRPCATPVSYKTSFSTNPSLMSSPVSQSFFHAQLEALYCGWPRDEVQPCYLKLNGMATIRRFYSMCRYQRLKV